MTTIYLVRHSEPLKDNGNRDIKYEKLILSNINNPLSVNGEHIAENISNSGEFDNLDVIFSSNYVRAIETAKYFSNRNNLVVNISDKLGERIHGIDSWEDLPSDFEIKQFEDENYKIGNGESRKEVTDRVYSFVNELLDNYKDKRILIVGHATAFMFLLMKWCDVKYNGEYRFMDKVFFDGKWNYCEVFKLEFDDKKLTNIKNIKINR